MAVYGKFFDLSGQNALVSMLVSLLMLYFLRMVKERGGIAGAFFKALIVFCALAWVTVLRGAYGLCVVGLVAIFYLFYHRNGWKIFLGALVSLLYVTGPLAFYGVWCYDGLRKDSIPKYAYYWFYPVHLLVLGGGVMMFFLPH